MEIATGLILDACEPYVFDFTVEDHKDGSLLRIVEFGQIDFKGEKYAYGMKFNDYINSLYNHSSTLSIIFFRISTDDLGEFTCYSSDVNFTFDDKKEILSLIKYNLNAIVVAHAYSTCCLG